MTTYLSHLAIQSPTVQVESARMARLLDACDKAIDDISDFSLRMAGHGLSVSSSMMRRDLRYALEQLRYAHSLPDEPLQHLAATMEREFVMKKAKANPVT